MLVQIIRVFLALAFFSAGTLKIVPSDLVPHAEEMRKEFVTFATKSLPFGIEVNPDVYRLVVGITEFLSSVVLLFGSPSARRIVNAVLIIVMIGAVYTHIALQQPIASTVPAIVLGLLLILHYWLSKPEKSKEQ
ncbi:transmembrane protein 35B-like [Oscarella lobularis]|uniref:transmembrane protein 35B-like n=1 Tax=Oscarella lobularis TaxID=121494 RepID=UPI0033130BED